jgi:hypothetical protein
VPAALLVTGLAWMYTRFGSLPEMASVLYGIRPVAAYIILGQFGDSAEQPSGAPSMVVGVAAATLSLAGLAPVAVLLVRASPSPECVAPGSWPVVAVALPLTSSVAAGGSPLRSRACSSSS